MSPSPTRSSEEPNFYRSVLQLGRIFDVSPGAEAFVQSIKSGLAETETKLKGVKPLKTFIASGVGQGSLVTRGGDFEGIALSGGTNLFGDLPPLVGGMPPAVSFEQVVGRDPEAIVIDDPGSTDPQAPSIEATKALLRERLKTTTAVKNDRFCVVKRLSFSGGPRTVEAVKRTAQCLHPEVGF